jgi:molecular chaperone DnaJ
VSKRDYYEVLGVPRDADDQQIKSAYRKLALQYHPDRNPGDQTAEERFKEAAEAYAVLAVGDKRARYDRFGHAAVGGSSGAPGFDPTIFADFNDIFGGLGGLGDIFGFGTGRRGGPARGGDLRYNLEISFDEMASGTETTLQIPREERCEACEGSGAAAGSRPDTCQQCRGRGQVRYQQGFLTVARTCGQCRGAGTIIRNPCGQCQGRGRTERERKLTVKVPAGIGSGQRLRIYGEGEHGPAGGTPGDLYVVIHVQDHEFFQRESDDLHCAVPVGYPTLVLGGTIAVPTLGGSETINVPKGTPTEARFRLRSKGLPRVSGRGQGDLYVTVRVEVPTSLSHEQKSLIAKLDKTMPHGTAEPIRPDSAREEERPFFDRVKDIFG